MVISQPKYICDLTTKDIGDLTTKRYCWSHNQKILVISQPKDTGHFTTKKHWWSYNQRYWRSHNQKIFLIS